MYVQLAAIVPKRAESTAYRRRIRLAGVLFLFRSPAPRLCGGSLPRGILFWFSFLYFSSAAEIVTVTFLSGERWRGFRGLRFELGGFDLGLLRAADVAFLWGGSGGVG
jgi:hypothetical protein